MYMLIRLCNGNVVKAAVLAKKPSWMRVAVAGSDDALELRLCGPFWFDEHDEPVHFAFTSLFSSGFCWQRMMEAAGREDRLRQRLDTSASAVSLC